MNDLQRILNNDYKTFFLIAGPCAVESLEVCMEVGSALKEICAALEVPYIFKASFRKANRTSGESFKGIGDASALEILRKVKESLQVPITTDIHEIADIANVSEVVDLLQIPAFLCRQTDLLEAAGASGKVVNIKKGQFMSGEAMRHAVTKVQGKSDNAVFLTERGNSFGYQDLVVDARNVAVMSEFASTIMDCTHATQRPNQKVGITGGNPAEIELFAKLGLVSGAKGLFIEMHPDPARALSDGASMLALSEAKELIQRLVKLSSSLHTIYA